jgi:hypothetical protein
VNIDLCEEALEYGRQAHRALESAGGDQLVRIAEQQPNRRENVVAPALDELGAWELNPRDSADELEAGAALCRTAGYWAVPYPVAERLCRPIDLDADGLLVINDVEPAAAVAALDLRWAAVTLEGRRSMATARPLAVPSRESAFVTKLDLHPVDTDGAEDAAFGLVLPCWTLLGMLDRALQLTRVYVRQREQFGQPLASFQGVQFQLTDAEVERAGLEELAKYSLWSLEAGHDDAFDAALNDALALRLAAVEAADVVFRVAHQLHGTIGFCDETTLSWVSRYSVPLRHLPFRLSATRHQLTRRLGRRGLSGLFDEAVSA